ncbi:MAG: hypothetical protein ACE5IR_01225 [bacterium]
MFLTIYNVKGELVRNLFAGDLQPGVPEGVSPRDTGVQEAFSTS